MRARLASLTLAVSMLFTVGCSCWCSGTCFPRIKNHFCGSNCKNGGIGCSDCAMGGGMASPVMFSGGGYAPGADCGCQGSASFHPAIMSPGTPTLVPAPAPAPAQGPAPAAAMGGPVMPTDAAMFPQFSAPITSGPAYQGMPTTSAPPLMNAPMVTPSRIPGNATATPYRP